MLSCITYLNTLNFLKFMSISDLIFIGWCLIVIIVVGMFLQSSLLLLSKTFTFMVIYSLTMYIILASNIPKGNYIGDSFIFSSYDVDLQANKLLYFLYFFSLIFFVILYSYISMGHVKSNFEYPTIILLSIVGMILLLRSSDLFVWFLTIEIQSFCFYALAAYKTNRLVFQTEAGLKYFLIGSVASSLYLYAISFLYLYTGTINLDSIQALFNLRINDQYLVMPILAILVSLFFKLGIAPFHFWVPIVYTYSSTMVTYLFILLPKISLFYLLYKFIVMIPINIIYIPIFCSIFIGTLFAFQANNIKTFLAYGAIANATFFLAVVIYQNAFSFSAFVFYLFSYSVLITIAFLPILFLIRSSNSWAIINLRDLIILKKSNPLLAIYYSLAFFGFAGIPPLLGFFSKFMILMSLVSFSAYLLVAILLFFSLISAYYYLRIVKILYFSSNLKYASLIPMPFTPALIITLFSIMNVFFTILTPFFPVVFVL